MYFWNKFQFICPNLNFSLQKLKVYLKVGKCKKCQWYLLHNEFHIFIERLTEIWTFFNHIQWKQITYVSQYTVCTENCSSAQLRMVVSHVARAVSESMFLSQDDVCSYPLHLLSTLYTFLQGKTPFSPTSTCSTSIVLRKNGCWIDWLKSSSCSY